MIFVSAENYRLPEDGDDWTPGVNRAFAASAAVSLPPGVLVFRSPVDLPAGATLSGSGIALTHCRFIGTAYGFGVRRYSPPGGGTSARLTDLRVVASDAAEDADAVVVDTGFARVERVHADAWPRDGFHVDASASRNPPTNANHARLTDCLASGNGRHGYYFDGADANDCAVWACSATNNDGDGFHDASFLGNQFVACHGAHNGGPDYVAEGDSMRSTFVGCYSESRQDAQGNPLPTVKIARSSLWLQGRGLLDPSAPSASIGAAPGAVSIPSLAGGAAGAVATQLGSTDPTTALTVAAGSDSYRLRWMTTGGLSGLVAWAWKGVTSLGAFAMTTGGHARGPGLAVVPRSLLLGLGSTQRSISTAVSMPTTPGTVGDIVLAATPTDTLDGWRYVASPNGNYWRAFRWDAGV